MDINVETVVGQNLQLVGNIGATLGGKFHKIEPICIWAGGETGLEEKKLEIKRGNSQEFVLDRSPKKFSMKSYRIEKVEVVKDAVTGQVVILINGGEGGQFGQNTLELPITQDLVRAGVVDNNAVAKALNGDKNHFFLDSAALAAILNRANEGQVQALKTLRESIDKMIQNIMSCIADNTRRATQDRDEWNKSKIDPDLSGVLKKQANAIVITDNVEQ